MIRSKYFNFGFVQDISKFIILRKNIWEVRSLYKLCGVSLNVQRAKTKLKFTRAWKFECVQECCNIPMIVMLYHSEVNLKISDADIETAEFNDCRELLENNIDTNSILAVI